MSFKKFVTAFIAMPFTFRVSACRSASFLVLVSSFFGAGACAEDAEIQGGPALSVVVEGAYARAVPSVVSNTAAYMLVTNNGEDLVALLGGECRGVRKAAIHGHNHHRDQVMMMAMDKVVIKPGAAASLEPGGLHLMLMGVERPLVAGVTLDCTLLFNDGLKYRLSVPVRAILGADG